MSTVNNKKIVVAVSGTGDVVCGTVKSLVLRKIGVTERRYRESKRTTLSGHVDVWSKNGGSMKFWHVTEDVELMSLSGVLGLNASSKGFRGYKNGEKV